MLEIGSSLLHRVTGINPIRLKVMSEVQQAGHGEFHLFQHGGGDPDKDQGL